MAVRRPLILTGSNDLIEMTDAQRNAVKDRCRFLYGANPSVTLSYVASSGNISPTMTDTRMTAGEESTSTTAIPDEATTDEPGSASETFDHINQNISSVSATPDTNNIAFPVYYSGAGILNLECLEDILIHP